MKYNFKKYASLYNWLPESVKKSQKKDTVLIDDLTLEGECEEMAGITLSEMDKIEIATRLSDLGVPRLSVLGHSPMPPLEEIRIVEKILDLGLPIKIGSFVRTQEEIEIASQLGLFGVTILVIVNEYLLPPGKTIVDIIEQSEHLTSFAKDEGLYTSFMAMDSTRTELETLKEVILEVKNNCDELCIADSVGVASPWGFRYLIEQVSSWTKLSLSVHLHNHTSMAVANALAAVLGGASVLHTTVNGLGEFSGLLPLEEMAVALPIHLGVSTGIRLEGLKDISDLVSRATGVPISIHKPAVGDYTFAVPETEDIQQFFFERAKQGPINEILTYPPDFVGNRIRFSIGRQCNVYTVRYNLDSNGWTAPPSTIQAIVEAVRRRANEKEGHYIMEESDFIKMIKEEGFELTRLDTRGRV
jgi:methanogen homocitrate synthase